MAQQGHFDPIGQSLPSKLSGGTNAQQVATTVTASKTDGHVATWVGGNVVDSGVVASGLSGAATPILDDSGNPIFDASGNWIYAG